MRALDPGLIAGLSVILLVVTAAACYKPVDMVLALTHE